MVRKLSLMLVLTLGFVPLAAQALGLGDIRPNSALNQKFNAEIKLTSVAKGQIDDIKVAVASDEAFKRSGVDRTYLLSKLRFTPELKADGTAIIRITSSEPIREPFLNFLIEVNWPKGRLVREYTVLLDPPVTLERKPAPIQAPAITKKRVAPPKAAPKATPKPAKKQAPAVQPAYAGPLDEVEVQKNASLWVIARKHRYPGVDQHRMMMAIYHANPRAFIRNNINRLKQGAILRIPNKEDVLALGVRAAQREYKQHVEAWHADGKVARQKVAQKPAPEPMAEMQREPDKDQAEPVEPTEQETPIADVEPETEVEAKTVEEPAEAEGELKIATARPEGEGEAGPSEDSEADQTISRLKQELLIVEEDAERSRGEGEELASRVDDLENQLEDLERILELKSEQFATMQAALARSEEKKNFLEKSKKQLEDELAYSQKDTAAEPAAVTEESIPEVAEEESDTEIVTEEAKPEPVVEEAKPEPVVAEEPKPDSVVKPIAEAETAPVPSTREPAKEPSLLDAIMGNPTMLGIMVGVIIILLALVWILLSRKRSNATDFQESILLKTDDDEIAGILEEADDIPGHTEETSFLSDFSLSDIDALQDETGEVDPLSEADVYIAYGRYQQAEELIRQAIDKEPERDVLKYKLFEILYAVKNTDGFISLAEEATGTPVETSDHSSWMKVLSMGKMLSPEHPMFSSADEIDADDDLFTLDDDLLDEELDENDFADLDATLTQANFGVDQEVTESEAKTVSETETDTTQQEDDLLDDELLSLSDELSDTAVSTDDIVSELEDLEFDTSLDTDSLSVALDELKGLDDQEPSEEQQEEDQEADDLMLSLSDLEDESEKTVLSLHADTSMEQDDANEELPSLDLEIVDEASLLDEELPSLDLETADEDISLDEELPALDLEMADESSSLEEELLANELEDTVIDFPEEKPEKAKFELDLEEDIDIAKDMDVDISVDEDMQDEVKTKLDLARAYAEMGDKDGAIDILDEVLSEGDETQKQEAQQIKESLS